MTEAEKRGSGRVSLPDLLRGFAPETALILGSGLGGLVESLMRVEGSRDYADLEGFPTPTVPGHSGRMLWGWCGDRRLAVMSGRLHYYEGHPLSVVVHPVRELARSGVRVLVLTNAAGGIRDDLQVGTIMALQDHINFLGQNPLRGPNEAALGPRFPDMSQVYDPGLRSVAQEVASRCGLPLPSGVYLAASGPSYETPAEIRAFRLLGADAVGMSTVPEAIAARHAGLRVAAFSCITNRAAGLARNSLDHEEVTAAGAAVAESFGRFLREFLQALPHPPVPPSPPTSADHAAASA